MATKTKPVDTVAPAESTAPRTISFRLVRNVILPALAEYMKSGVYPQPGVTMKEIPGTEREITVTGKDPYTQALQRQRTLKSAVAPVFNMSTVYTIELESTEPREIERKAGLSEAWIEKLQDKEMERALAAQDRMDALRRTLRHHATPLVEGGIPAIQIVEDESHFMDESAFLSDTEAARREEERQDRLGRDRATLAAATGAK